MLMSGDVGWHRILTRFPVLHDRNICRCTFYLPKLEARLQALEFFIAGTLPWIPAGQFATG